jgi:hypothetical protein
VEGILSAGDLMGVAFHPVQLSRPQQLVYSGHIYPFSPIISDLEYPLFKSLMHTMQTFVADAGHAYSAPYWMGEFGCGGDRSVAAGAKAEARGGSDLLTHDNMTYSNSVKHRRAE